MSLRTKLIHLLFVLVMCIIIYSIKTKETNKEPSLPSNNVCAEYIQKLEKCEKEHSPLSYLLMCFIAVGVFIILE